MSTASTKSRTDKQTEPAGALPRGESGYATGGTSEPQLPERVWRIASLAILIIAALFRFYALSLKPLHHDEGVNGFFFTRLFRMGVFTRGSYTYDPANYHGPTLYYFTLPFAWLLGLETFALRTVTALFGVATVWLILRLRKYLGTAGALAAAALAAVSPGAVFFSRYFIHESLFVFFTLGIVVAVLRYYETANHSYLMLASALAGLLFATKETAFISAGVLLIAMVGAEVYVRYVAPVLLGSTDARRRGRKTHESGRKATVAAAPFPAASPRFPLAAAVCLAVGIFIAINILFYSSFFTNGEGLGAALRAFQFWTRTGTRDHVYPYYKYLDWLAQEEAPLLVLGALGFGLAMWRATSRFAVFAALWAFGIVAAYSLIPYKTPWLALNFIIPLAIIGGYGIGEIYGSADDTMRRAVAAVLLLAAAAAGSYQAIVLNFINYDSDRYPYVYAHTQRGFLALVNDINRLAQASGEGTATAISVFSPDYWPLPWYLRDYTRVGYHGRPGAAGDAALVLGNLNQDAELHAMLGPNFQRVGAYQLRPGVTLVLYARRDLIKP